RRSYNVDLAAGTFPILDAIGVLEDVVFSHRVDTEQLRARPGGRNEHGGRLSPNPVDPIDQQPVGLRPMARNRETGISAASHIRSIVDNADIESQKLIEASTI